MKRMLVSILVLQLFTINAFCQAEISEGKLEIEEVDEREKNAIRVRDSLEVALSQINETDKRNNFIRTSLIKFEKRFGKEYLAYLELVYLYVDLVADPENYIEAIDLLFEVRPIYKKEKKSETTYAEITFTIGMYYFIYGDYENAITYMQEVSELADLNVDILPLKEEAVSFISTSHKKIKELNLNEIPNEELPDIEYVFNMLDAIIKIEVEDGDNSFGEYWKDSFGEDWDNPFDDESFKTMNSWLSESLPYMDELLADYPVDIMEYAISLDNAANEQLGSKKRIIGDSLLASISSVLKNHINQSAGFNLNYLLAKSRWFLEASTSYVTKVESEKPELTTILYDQILNFKENVANQQKRISFLINSDRKEKNSREFKSWKEQYDLVKYYSTLNFKELEKENISIWKEFSKLTNLEKKLNTLLPEDGNNDISSKQIKDILLPTEASIEIIRYVKFENGGWTNDINYIALLIRSDLNYPKLIFLGDGKSLEQKYYKQYLKARLGDEINFEIYNQFWKPISKHLSGIEKIYLSGDGIYNVINLNTLSVPGKQNKYLLDELDLHLLTNTKSIIDIKKTIKRKNSDLNCVLIGNPQFYLNEKANDSNVSSPLSPKGKELENRNRWKELIGTEKEVLKISEILRRNNFNTRVFTNKKATERNLKQVSNPNILHIATHGYFLPLKFNQLQFNGISEEEEGSYPTLGSYLVGVNSYTVSIEFKEIKDSLMYKIYNPYEINPALRSGIILAGASNTSLKTKFDDGILTANEANGLNLSDTELVILSACETGVGLAQNGQGINGLQQAFQIAGAKSIITSLWKVRDDVTEKFMVLFYTNWIEKGMTKREAFRQTQLDIRKEYREPYLWGGFIIIGE